MKAPEPRPTDMPAKETTNPLTGSSFTRENQKAEPAAGAGKDKDSAAEPADASGAAEAQVSALPSMAAMGEVPPADAQPDSDTPVRKVPLRDDMLILSDEKSVGIFLHPLRQRMLERMMILAEPVTSKKLADELGIAPSSARHHMQKLESIGVVEKDHQQLIHGILATYYRLTDKCISLDVCNTGLWDPARRLLEENARQVREGALKMMKDWEQSPSRDWDDAWGLLETNGVINLTRKEAIALRDMIVEYLQQYSHPRPGTAPIRFDVVSYRAGEVKEDDDS